MLPRKILLIFADFGIVLALDLAFLGFSLNGISAELAILPFYDFVSIPIYQITLGVMIASSIVISVAIFYWRRNLYSTILFAIGIFLQVGVTLNLVLQRTLYEPVFLVLSEDPGLHNAEPFKISFYVAPWYELIDTLTFIFFVLGILLFFARAYPKLGIAKSFFAAVLAASGLLLYFEYVTLKPLFADGSASSIPSEKLTNFSNGWPLIGALTNIDLYWISVATLAVSGLAFVILLVSSANTMKLE